MNTALLRLGALETGMALLFGVVSYRVGLEIFRRFMGVPDLWAEIVRKRNLALALLLGAFVAGMLVLMSASASAASELAASLLGERGTVPLGRWGFILRLGAIYLVSAGGSVLILMASLWIYDMHTPELRELDTVRKGNAASAMLLSAFCISAFLLMARPFATLFRALAPPLRTGVPGLAVPVLNLPVLRLGLAEVALTLAGLTLLCNLGLRFMRTLDPQVDEGEAAEEENLGVACFVAFSILAFARFLGAGLLACGNVSARLLLGERPSLPLVLGSGLGVLALLAGSLLLGALLTRLGLLLFSRLIHRTDPEAVILRGNLPAALVAGAFVLSLAVLMGHGAEALLTGFSSGSVHLGGGMPLPSSRR